MKKLLFTALELLCAILVTAQGFNQNEAYEGLYANMRQTYFPNVLTTSTNDLARSLFHANNLTSDESYCIWSDAGIPAFNRAMPTADLGLVSDLWNTLFWQIDQCNVFLENAVGDDVLTQKQRAEARVLRALFYAYAIDLWGDVPLWLSSDKSQTTPRTLRAQVFDWIEAELKEVMPALDAPTNSVYGHVNKGVAQLLLARLYLNAEVYTGISRWAEARQQADDLLSSGWYTLCPTYSYLFMGDNDSNGAQNEMVLPLLISADMVDNWGNTTYLIAATHDANMPDCGLVQYWLGLVVRNNLLQKFQSFGSDERYLFYGDGRRDGSVLTSDFDFYQGYSCMKYTNLRSDNSTPTSPDKPDTDFPLMRLAEAYLIYAEADARLNGGSCTASGLARLNELRQRAGASPFAAADLSTLVDEWSREFYFEGRRRTDLVRFGLYSTGSYQWPGRGNDVCDLFPLPMSVVQTYGFAQNPGYEDMVYKPSSMVLDAPQFGNMLIDLLQFQLVCFSWQRPADATTKLTYDLQVAVSEEGPYGTVLTTTEENGWVTNKTLYDMLVNLGAQEDAELTAYVRVSVHGVPSNVVPIRVKTTNPVVRLSGNAMWCLTGSVIADGSWSNSPAQVGTGMIPFYSEPASPGVLTYTGYFSQDNFGQFKLVKDYSWAEQFGSGELNGNASWVSYGDGENITVLSSGCYTITIREDNDGNYYADVAGVADSPVYGTIYMPGEYNGWNAGGNPLSPVTTIAGVENHDWQSTVTFAADTEVKFAADGSWNTNWGSASFPTGRGVQDGSNIQVKAGTYKVLFNDITGHYLFLDSNTGAVIADGTGHDELRDKMADGRYLNTAYATITATGVAPINVSEINGRVKVAEMPAGADYSSLALVVDGKIVAGVAADGTISESDAMQFYGYGMNVPLVTLSAKIRGIAFDKGVGVYTESDSFSITFLQDINYTIDETYYYIGSQTDWTDSKVMPLTKEGEGVFRLVWHVPAGTDEWLKVMPARAMTGNGVDWSDQVGAGSDNASIGTGLLAVGENTGAWHIAPEQVDKTYTLIINFSDMTYTLAEGEASALSNPAAGVKSTGQIYLLNGMRLRSAGTHGIYIRDGKKFVK